VTISATQHDADRRIAELDERERDAWERYHEEVRTLDGKAYAIAEPAAWDTLQMTLDEVKAERIALTPVAPH